MTTFDDDRVYLTRLSEALSALHLAIDALHAALPKLREASEQCKHATMRLEEVIDTITRHHLQ